MLNQADFKSKLIDIFGKEATGLFWGPIAGNSFDKLTDAEKSVVRSQIADRSESWADELASAITAYIRTADVLNVKTALDAGVRPVEIFVAGVGSNGGSLNAFLPVPPDPVSGVVNDSVLPTATQTNIGTLN